MRNAVSLVVGGLLVSSTFVVDAKAATVFSDGFEGQTDPLGAPVVGNRWFDSTGVDGSSYDLATGANQYLSGSTGLRILAGAGLNGVSNSGAMVAGNTVTYTFNVNHLQQSGEPGHTFNNPTQISIGFANGLAGRMARLGTLGAGGDNKYGATNAGTVVNSTIAPLVNTAGFDTIRAVLSLTSPGAGQIGGTYDVFVSLDGGAEVQIADDFALTTVAIPGGADATRAAFAIQRTGNPSITSSPYFDDFTIDAVAAAVPEPATMALGMMAGGLLLGRRRAAAK